MNYFYSPRAHAIDKSHHHDPPTIMDTLLGTPPRKKLTSTSADRTTTTPKSDRGGGGGDERGERGGREGGDTRIRDRSDRDKDRVKDRDRNREEMFVPLTTSHSFDNLDYHHELATSSRAKKGGGDYSGPATVKQERERELWAFRWKMSKLFLIFCLVLIGYHLSDPEKDLTLVTLKSEAYSSKGQFFFYKLDPNRDWYVH
jgi:hypothetical protein